MTDSNPKFNPPDPEQAEKLLDMEDHIDDMDRQSKNPVNDRNQAGWTLSLCSVGLLGAMAYGLPGTPLAAAVSTLALGGIIGGLVLAEGANRHYRKARDRTVLKRLEFLGLGRPKEMAPTRHRTESLAQDAPGTELADAIAVKRAEILGTTPEKRKTPDWAAVRASASHDRPQVSKVPGQDPEGKNPEKPRTPGSPGKPALGI